ncbi:hypothetical protein O1611_g7475 [Lasiodiplodia mahajangana]|uniref:Uncharacterized protein n=1 Tax=Lasiodiplodia mahajangana TaxID=1108764 RepID=A0ACC2JFM9_9PEZI|nr:hypothetical protein O1611_g7475 [Lasiodiplodia mahajangana]
MEKWKRKAKGFSDPWWRPELKANDYKSGEAHDDDGTYRQLAAQWDVDERTLNDYPYLARIKRLSETGWIHLRLLVDFMSIGAVPQRWDDLNPNQNPLSSDERVERKEARRKCIEKTNVSVLDYYSTEVKRKEYTSTQELKRNLDSGIEDNGVKFRLYVVEDLSRDVIDALGQKFRIEPDFFRAHIVDYAWYNVRDPWRNPPMLDIVSRHQNWMQLRYVTARYFDIDERDDQKGGSRSFKEATKEAANFNILRRVDDDLSNKSFWDKQGAIVGLTRSRATFWLQPEKSRQGAPVGILLLDPTVTKGVPLWRGRRTLWSMPPTDEQADSSRPPPQDNFFEDFIFWAQQKDLYPNFTTDHTSETLVPLQVLLHLVCSEWLTMSDYIKTRLNQLDWEIVKPEFFRLGKRGVDNMLQKLHMWRRLVPLYREMVSETIRHIDQFSSRIQIPNPNDESNGPPRVPLSAGQDQWNLSSCYNPDFSLIKSQLEEYQTRIDQLTAVVTAVISIDNSRRGLQDNRNIGRLTWLATFFIPLSLVAGVLSMQSNVSDISGDTFKVYFATSLPLAVVIAVAALTLSVSRSETKKALRKIKMFLADL